MATASYGGGIAGFANVFEKCSNSTNCAFSYSGITSGNTDSSYEGGLFGGICGLLGHSVSLSSNNGTVTGNNSYTAYVGGIVGKGALQSTISQCANSGNVTGETSGNRAESYVGGISGGIRGAYSAISDCYNTGDIYTRSRNYSGMVGGITGYGENTTIKCCYNIGNLNNASKYSFSYRGGMIGLCHISSCKVTNCYSYKYPYAGSGNVQSKVTTKDSLVITSEQAQLLTQKDTYVGFDFENIWDIDNSNEFKYPCLRDLMFGN